MVNDQSRRRAIVTVGSSLFLAGCSSSASEPNSDDTQTVDSTTTTDESRLELGETAEDGAKQVTIEDTQFQQLVARRSSSHVTVTGSRETGYVVASITTNFGPQTGCSPSDLNLELDVDGSVYPIDEDCLYDYERKNREGDVSFEIPNDVAAETASIRWVRNDGTVAGAWPISERTSAKLSSPPRFAVESFDVPAEAKEGEDVTASLEVKNEGESSGTFRYVLETPDRTTPIYEYFEIESGERAKTEHEISINSVHQSSSSELELSLDWGVNTLRRTIEVNE